jgi:hypothetical protein
MWFPWLLYYSSTLALQHNHEMHIVNNKKHTSFGIFRNSPVFIVCMCTHFTSMLWIALINMTLQ